MALAGTCALVIVACGSTSSTTGDENRQFANEASTRTPDTELTVTPTTVLDVDATPEIRTPSPGASPETLLHARGAPDTLYIEIDGHLVSVTSHGGKAVALPIELPAELRLIDSDASPAGDRVAVLLEDAHGAASLGFFGQDGALQAGPFDVLREDAATPVTDAPKPGQYFVDWSPQGLDVLVSDGAALEAVRDSGAVERVALDGFDGVLVAAERSPQGSRIALQFQAEDGGQRVYVRDVTTGKTRDLRPLSVSAGEGLDHLQWLPNGSGLIYVHGSLDRGVLMHGQVWVYRLGQERADPVATAGQGGPAATITDVVVSPDGRSVAYVISLLDGTKWSFHSMWVRSLDGNLIYRVPVVPRGVVGYVQWVSGGLSWEQRRESSAPGQLLVIGANGLPNVVLDMARSPFAATPEASPEASPVGTPQATPIASPVATP